MFCFGEEGKEMEFYWRKYDLGFVFGEISFKISTGGSSGSGWNVGFSGFGLIFCSEIGSFTPFFCPFSIFAFSIVFGVGNLISVVWLEEIGIITSEKWKPIKEGIQEFLLNIITCWEAIFDLIRFNSLMV